MGQRTNPAPDRGADNTRDNFADNGSAMPTWDVTFDRNVALDDPALFRAVAEAEAVARFIRGVPLPPVVQERLDRLNIMRAVRGTTGIEGTELAEEEVGRILEAPPETPVLPPSRARDEQEARNAATVMEFVARAIRADPARPLTEELVCELHRLTTEGIDYPHNEPGVYRSHAVRVGDYVPPRAADDVRRLMAEFADWLNTPPVTGWPPIVRAVAAHFYFVSIHPFGDGNGRTARAVESYLLYQTGVNVLGFHSLANFYYRNRPEYIALLDRCRFDADGDLTPFVRFAIEGLVEELDAVRAEVIAAITAIAFREHARSTILSGTGMSMAVRGRLAAFMDGLVEPVGEDDLLARRGPLAYVWAGVSRKTLTRDLARLEALGLIVREDGIVRPRHEAMSQFQR